MESWLLEYAATFRKENLLASLTNGARVSTLECPKLPLLCATLSSIVDKEEYEHFEKAICVLWELYKVVPHLIPFQEFGSLILDIKMLKLLSTMTDHNYSAEDITKLFEIPGRIVFQNEEENFTWFDWKTKQISRKMTNFVSDKEGRREISSYFGFTNLALLKDIKRKVNEYVEKMNKKSGLTMIEVFSRLSQHLRCKTKCIRKSVSHKTKKITNPAVSGEPSRVKTSETVENLSCSGPSGPVHGKHNSIIRKQSTRENSTTDNQLNTVPHLDYGANGVNDQFNDHFHNLNFCDKQTCSDQRGEHSRQSHCDQQSHVKRKTVNNQPRLLGTDKASIDDQSSNLSKITNDCQSSLSKPQSIQKQPTNGTDKANMDDQPCNNHSKITKNCQGSLGKQQSMHNQARHGTDQTCITTDQTSIIIAGNHGKTTKDRQGSLGKPQSMHNQARHGTEQTCITTDQTCITIAGNHGKTTKDRQGSLSKPQSIHNQARNATDQTCIDDQPDNNRKTTKDCQESLGKQQIIHNQARNGTDQTCIDDQPDNNRKTTKDCQESLGKQQIIHNQAGNGTDQTCIDDQPDNHSKTTKDCQESLGKQQIIHNQARNGTDQTCIDDQPDNHSKTTKDHQGSLGKQESMHNQARHGTDQTCITTDQTSIIIAGNHGKTTKDRQGSLGKPQSMHNQARNGTDKASTDDQPGNHRKTTNDCQGSLGKPQSMQKQPTNGTDKANIDDQPCNHSKTTKDCQGSLGNQQFIIVHTYHGTDQTCKYDQLQVFNHLKTTKDHQESLSKPQSMHNQARNGTDKASMDDQLDNHSKTTNDCQGSLGKQPFIIIHTCHGTDQTCKYDQVFNLLETTKDRKEILGTLQNIHNQARNGTDKASMDDQLGNHSKTTKNRQGSLGTLQNIHSQARNGTDQTCKVDQPGDHLKITNRKRKFSDAHPSERQTTIDHQIMPNVLQTSVCNIRQNQTCAPHGNINFPGNGNPPGSRYYLSHGGNSGSERVTPGELSRTRDVTSVVDQLRSSAASCPKQTGESNFPENLCDYCRGRMNGECHVTPPVAVTTHIGSPSLEKSILEKHPPAIQGNVADVNSRIVVQSKVKIEPQEFHEFPGNPPANPVSQKAMSESRGTSLITGNEGGSPCVVSQARSIKSERTVGDTEMNYDFLRKGVKKEIEVSSAQTVLSGNISNAPLFCDGCCQTSLTDDTEEDYSSNESSFSYSSGKSSYSSDKSVDPAAALRRTNVLGNLSHVKRSRKDGAKTEVRNVHNLTTGADAVSQNVLTVKSEKQANSGNSVVATGLGLENDGKPSRRRTRQILSSTSDEESEARQDRKRIRISCRSSPVPLMISENFQRISRNERFGRIGWLDCVVKLEKLRIFSLYSTSLAS